MHQRTFLFGFTLLLTTILVISCGMQHSEIHAIEVNRLFIAESRASIETRLSLFIHTLGETPNSIESMVLIDTNSGMRWTIDANKAEFFRNKEQHYSFGSNHLAYPSGIFPAGKYRVSILNFNGEESSKTFSLAKMTMPKKMPLSLVFEKKCWQIKKAQSLNKTTEKQSPIKKELHLVILGLDKKTIADQKLQDKLSGSLAELQQKYSNARYLQAALKDKEKQCIFFTAPLELPH